MVCIRGPDRGWSAGKVQHVLLAKFEPNTEFIRRQARWNRPPFEFRVTWEDDYWALFEIRIAGR